ncbi:YeeE/YedE family protein [Chlorogloeopsis sp. ULAP01]|uniref:YeeE/YedE family protein n=1 Tax=Chlorogloeopsis sp. ULAP01 TaxID=3056483 RepID=UPI0025AA71C5|nr:YeeE/YedE family protein [Chlorogloeopsis sp. ULAP01]MDM9383981.1 YeeE/YedE family protein [Chlorogloeopsis sp. ULAP01]
MSSVVGNNLPSGSKILPPRPQKLIVAIALAVLAGGAVALSSYGWRQSVLFLIGGLLGVSLYHSAFGFTSAYRKLLVNRDVQGIYAQLVMLAIATILFAPVLAAGSVFGQKVEGAIAPVGVQGAIGAFLFGIGMQLGGGCGCGTLYTIGGGSITMLITLFTFCVGAFWASLTRHIWSVLPQISPIVFGESLGWVGAVGLQLGLFILIAGLLWWWNQRSRNQLQTKSNKAQILPHPTEFLSGPWPLFTGAIALATLNWLTLIISGEPWRITWGFALWAAKIATIFGWNPDSSPFWEGMSFSDIVVTDVSSVMNVGIILGAALAAASAGKLVAKTQISLAVVIATIIGGLMMGYGAFIAFGCNVSAFFSGIASTSLHGWIWIICALLGTGVGIRFRSLLKLVN